MKYENIKLHPQKTSPAKASRLPVGFRWLAPLRKSPRSLNGQTMRPRQMSMAGRIVLAHRGAMPIKTAGHTFFRATP